MAVKVFSCLAHGLEGKLVEVEADILQGLSAFSIVGLGDAAVQEAKERIRSAIKNSGFTYPQTKKIINLAPAHLKKQGPHFDLPMAVGLLAASGQIGAGALQNHLLVGELALDGSVRPVNGVLTFALFAAKNGWGKIMVPSENFEEAALIKNLEIIPVHHLRDVMNYFKNPNGFKRAKNGAKSLRAQTSESRSCVPKEATPNFIDLADIHGQEQAKRTLIIAAAGSHHLLFTGPPGVGKTMLARAMPGILPPLTEEEMFEVMQIYSLAGLASAGSPAGLSGSANSAGAGSLMRDRPFRQVHPTCTLLSLTGGGATLKPGEISLAHHGILFLDEIAEFPRSHLESLRQPLEEKGIHLSRASGSFKYPANFTLIASMNPCPCGYSGDSKKGCRCRPYQIIQYQKKLSGPVLDRIDLAVEVPRQPAKIFQQKSSQKSEDVRKKVAEARAVQKVRFRNSPFRTNNEMSPAQLKIHCRLSDDTTDLLREAAENFSFSGRNYHQVIKISRTIADLNAHDEIELQDLNEALQYRPNTTPFSR